MRPRTVILGALVAMSVPVGALGLLTILPRSVIEDFANPPPTPLPAQPPCPTASEPAPLCIVVLGDSIADGVPLSGDDRWWMRLERALSNALPDRQVSVVSWAVPRSRVDVLESAANDQAALDTFDVAIVVEGVNDVGRTPTGEWAKRYQAAVEHMEARGVEVVVAAPPPNLVDGALQHRHDEIDDAVRAIAKPGRPLLDIAARFRQDGDVAAARYYADSLHQDTAGQEVIANLATDIVLGLVPAR